MPTNTFALMNIDLAATPLPRDVAQGAAQNALYADFFATCLAHGAAKRRERLSAADVRSATAPDQFRVDGRNTIPKVEGRALSSLPVLESADRGLATFEPLRQRLLRDPCV
jgi:hypothetical protein